LKQARSIFRLLVLINNKPKDRSSKIIKGYIGKDKMIGGIERNLEHQCAFLKLHGKYKVAGSNGYRVNLGRKIIGRTINPMSNKRIKKTLLTRNCVIYLSVIFA